MYFISTVVKHWHDVLILKMFVLFQRYNRRKSKLKADKIWYLKISLIQISILPTKIIEKSKKSYIVKGNVSCFDIKPIQPEYWNLLKKTKRAWFNLIEKNCSVVQNFWVDWSNFNVSNWTSNFFMIQSHMLCGLHKNIQTHHNSL